jgi:nicotinamidase-related amidase
MKCLFERIVDTKGIGEPTNTINLSDILTVAAEERLQPAHTNATQVAVIAIDIQKDFMEKGSLGVPGSHADVERFTRWIHRNLDKIARISVSIDTHNPFQIFFPSWWIDKDGNHPAPFTPITVDDVESRKWIPLWMPSESLDYVKGLAAGGRQVLVIWPYHCIQGTNGHTLENQFANMAYFFQAAKLSKIEYIVKGFKPCTEMYGIFKPEYDPKNTIDMTILNKLQKYDKIVIAGQAKSHCVLESIRQMLELFGGNIATTSKLFILEDCMSTIPGFEDKTNAQFQEFKDKYKVNIVRSTDFDL